MSHTKTWEQRRRRIFTIIEIGSTGDYASKAYDLLYSLAIIVNLAVTIMYTFLSPQNAVQYPNIWYNVLPETILNRGGFTMTEEMRTFGYICPKCGKMVMGARSIFTLAASNTEVSCECGGSALQTEFDGEKYRLYVPCGLCGETHMAVCDPDRVLKGATALGCAQTKQFCCFIGPEGTVEKNLRELAILAEKERQQTEGEETVFVDNVIMHEILSELKDIASREKGITCGCGSTGYGMEIRRSAVDLVCRRCGAKLRIPAATDRDLDDLCCHMKLVIPGK